VLWISAKSVYNCQRIYNTVLLGLRVFIAEVRNMSLEQYNKEVMKRKENGHNLICDCGRMPYHSKKKAKIKKREDGGV